MINRENVKAYIHRIAVLAKTFLSRAKSFCTDMRKKILAFIACNEKTFVRAIICSLVLFGLWLLWALWLKFNQMNSILDSYYYFCESTVWERILFDVNSMKKPILQWGNWDEVLANSIVFAPFGVLFNMLAKKKNVWRDLAICFCISLFIELLQLFTLIGVFASIDLFTNTVGYLLGYAAYEFVFKRFPIKTNVWILRSINIGLFACLVFAAVNTARNIDTIIGILARTL